MFRLQLGIVVVLFVLCLHSMAQADNYVAIGGGVHLAELDSTDAGTIRLKNNGFFGAKIGHYIDNRQFNWFGWEVDLYRASPSVKQQRVNVSNNLAVSGPIPGADLLVHSLAFNALVRLTGYQYKVEPYTGIGIGLNVGEYFRRELQAGGILCPEFQPPGRHSVLPDPEDRTIHRIQIQLRPVHVYEKQSHGRLPRASFHVRHLLPFRQLDSLSERASYTFLAKKYKVAQSRSGSYNFRKSDRLMLSKTQAVKNGSQFSVPSTME